MLSQHRGQRPGLYRETIQLLGISGVTMFALGLFASEQYSDQPLIERFLFAVALLGVVALLLLATRFRNRLAGTEGMELQLSGYAHDPSEEAHVNLHPIMGTHPVNEGWNRLVDLAERRVLDSGIERRLQQGASNRKAERFARAIRSLAEGVVITDTQGKINYANPAWSSLLECGDHESLVGGSVAECLQVLAGQQWQEMEPKLLQGMQPLAFTIRKGKAIQDGILQLNRLPLDGRSNEADGFVFTIKDVTQQALANDAHEQFLASATHELRTPITNIRAYAESLLEVEDISADQQKEFFNVIHGEAGRLGRLLNQLLDIQQLEAGSMTIKSSAFDVLRMVQEAQDYVNPLVAEKSQELVCRIAPNLKTIEADKEKITSCVVNLLGNAVKYTPEEGEIRLFAEQHDHLIEIAVEDTGIGIAEEDLPHIFDRFYRCSDERVEDIEGNGLGLAFCKEVARLHGGELTVESEFNEGSRFVLRLPLHSRS